MPSLTPTPVSLPPGFVRKEGPRAGAGRYIDGDKVRFVRGKPEKIGGWTKLTTAAVRGEIVAIHSWTDTRARSYTAIGTTKGLFYYSSPTNIIDITPIASTTSLTNAFTTTSGSSTITVHAPSHGLLVGRYIEIESASSVGGVTPNGTFEVQSVPTSGTLTISLGAAATSSVSATGSCTFNTLLASGPPDPVPGFGFGAGGYGIGTYGTARSASPFVAEPRSWSLDNDGSVLIAAPYEGRLYEFDPTALPVERATLTAPSDAPAAMRGMWRTEERIIVCFGAASDSSPSTTSDSMLLWWSHQGDRTFWDILDVTKLAGQRRLMTGKKIVAGTALAMGVSLIWTDSAAIRLQFTGGKYIYNSGVVGTDCGLFGRQSYALAGSSAYWVGPGGFYQYVGGGVQPIPNSDDVREWIFGRLREYYQVKSFAFFNPKFREVWFLFVVDADKTPRVYAMYSLDSQGWATGTLSRTAAHSGGTELGSTRPILAGVDGFLYEHESGVDADGAAIDAWIKSGVFEVSNGAKDIDIHGFAPDFERHIGDLSLTITTRDRGAEAIIDEQTKAFAPAVGMIDLRINGRLINFTLRSNVVGGDFRMGIPTIETSISGGRR